MTDIPEADRTGDAPHPRDTARLVGHTDAQAAVLGAWNADRFPHAWLIAGPRGVGKATLAWRIARFLLTDPPRPADTLDPMPGHPALSRIRALSEPGLLLLRRAWDDKRKRLRAEITVDEARRLGPFFGMAAEGRRVVIVDSADELNRNAANAILKLLEEPPKGATLILIAHQPARLLPTIRSRCRTLRLDPLTPGEVAEAAQQAEVEASGTAAALAEGSVGAAITLADDGAGIYRDLVRLYAGPFDRGAARKLADSCGGRAGAERLEATLDLTQRLAHRAALFACGRPPEAAVPGEGATLKRLAPDLPAARRLADAATELRARADHARAVNVDPASIVWDHLVGLENAVR